MERTELIKDKALLKVLSDKKELVGEILEMNDSIKTLEDDRMDIAKKLDKVKSKILAGAKKHVDKVEVSEFEQVRTIDVIDGELVLTIIDSVEEFKEKERASVIAQAEKEAEAKKDK